MEAWWRYELVVVLLVLLCSKFIEVRRTVPQVLIVVHVLLLVAIG